MTVYPIFLNNLVGQRCVVIGGDHEAERKVAGLLDVGARIDVLSPDATEAIQAWAEAGRVEWHRRDYQAGDLAGAFLAIVSETNPTRTAPIWDEAQAEGVLFNAMDDVDHCTFVAGSVVRCGPLTLSISTSGVAPALAVRLRERFETEFDEAFATYLGWLTRLRPHMPTRFPDSGDRKAAWYAVVDAGLLPLLRAGQIEAAEAHLAALVGSEIAAAVAGDAVSAR